MSLVPVLFLSYAEWRRIFYLTLPGFALFILALLVTMLIEVPIVKRIETWTTATLPDDWQRLRDRWGRFHLIRIATSVVGLVVLLIAGIF